MRQERPWRAAAFAGSFTGAPLLGRTAAKTEEGLARFRASWGQWGATIVVWKVEPIPEVARLTQAADSSAG
jgi:hypothetical protein